MKIVNYILFISLLIIAACDPSIDEDISIPPLPEDPQMIVDQSPTDPNKIVIKDLSSGFFSRVWDLPGSTPPISTSAVDTAFYTKAGTYTITLHTAQEGGGGTSSSSATVEIAEDAILACTDENSLLTGECGLTGKCWTFSRAAGALAIGPEPGSGEWFSSQEDGLQDAQYDDDFCFVFDGSSFVYDNKGQTVDPFNGFAPVDYDPPTDFTYFLDIGGGLSGETRIVLPEGAFMGVWNSGPLYDIIAFSEDELVVRSEQTDGDGFFDLHFVAR